MAQHVRMTSDGDALSLAPLAGFGEEGFPREVRHRIAGLC